MTANQENPYASPVAEPAATRIKSQDDRGQSSKAVLIVVAAMVWVYLMLVLLPAPLRLWLLLAIALLFFLWPLIALAIPRRYLVATMLAPFIGVCMGAAWTSDMGGGYMFGALPTLFTGLWALLLSGLVLLLRE